MYCQEKVQEVRDYKRSASPRLRTVERFPKEVTPVESQKMCEQCKEVRERGSSQKEREPGGGGGKRKVASVP